MKHRKQGRKFGRVRAQRKALERTMLGSLVLHERMETTEAKAKELKGKIDRMITRSRRALAAKENPEMQMTRKLEGDLPLVAITKLRKEIMPRVGSRVSGFTRVVKLAPRKSDGAKMAIIEFVDKPKKAASKQATSTKEGTKKTTSKKAATRTTPNGSGAASKKATKKVTAKAEAK